MMGRAPRPGTATVLLTAAERQAGDRSMAGIAWGIVAVLVVWLMIGVIRQPPAMWPERGIVMALAACSTAPMIGTRGYRKKLPALDRTPRRAVVTGREVFNAGPEPESEVPTYVLVTVRAGYDLGDNSLHFEPGPGSDLLVRRYANDAPITRRRICRPRRRERP